MRLRLHALGPFVPMCAVLLFGLGAAAAIRPGAASDDRIFAAFFAPTWSAERAFAAVAASGGAVVREGILPTILTAQGGDSLKSSLYRHGAWLVIAAPAWACGARPTPDTQVSNASPIKDRSAP